MCMDGYLEKLESISNKQIINNGDLDFLLNMSTHGNEEIRAYVAEILIDSNTDISRMILINLCQDKESLVRVNACDSLCVFKDIEVFERLQECLLKDKNSLVRRYALLSIIDIMNDIDVQKDTLKNLLLSTLNKENLISIKISCYKGLYLLGNKEYLQLIVKELFGRNYRNRCTAINELADILNSENIGLIRTALLKRKSKEKTNAVISTINRVLASIDCQ